MRTYLLLIIFVFTGQSIFSQALNNTCNMPKLWFQHDDYFDIDGDNVNQIAPDMISRWINHADWDTCLDNMDVYSIHENLFKIGAHQGMGAKLYTVLKNYFDPLNTLDTAELYAKYFHLILPVLHAHNVELQIHTVGSKGDFVPWNMNGCDNILWPQDSSGLKLVLNTLNLVNGVCDSLFNDGYGVGQVKLQSVLSGHWKRGLQNNVYCALEYMKEIQDVYSQMKFYLGDALLQRRDCNNNLNWRNAYQTLHNTIVSDPKGYSHLNFEGIRIEFDKAWYDSTLYENAQGWKELSDSGAVDTVHAYG
ncbi:MAG: hypothetical protein ACT4ON_11935 [Bacteroidota bacterium]